MVMLEGRKVPFELGPTTPRFVLNLALNRLRQHPFWVEFADLGTGVEELWFVIACRRCRLTEKFSHPAGYAWFRLSHRHRGEDADLQQVRRRKGASRRR